MSKSLLTSPAQLRNEPLYPAKSRRFLPGMALAKEEVIVTKTSATRLVVLLSGFSLGVVCGALAVSSSARRDAQKAHPAAQPSSALVLVHAVAAGCGVYGLPDSPAVIALTAGAEGRPAKASVESDLFGDDELESCVLSGLAGLPMSRDTLRVVLPTHEPQRCDALAVR
jgi:hypothetical protein